MTGRLCKKKWQFQVSSVVPGCALGMVVFAYNLGAWGPAGDRLGTGWGPAGSGILKIISVMGNLDLSRVSSEPSESKATCALG
jgi:hypothetical protein